MTLPRLAPCFWPALAFGVVAAFLGASWSPPTPSQEAPTELISGLEEVAANTSGELLARSERSAARRAIQWVRNVAPDLAESAWWDETKRRADLEAADRAAAMAAAGGIERAARSRAVVATAAAVSEGRRAALDRRVYWSRVILALAVGASVAGVAAMGLRRRFGRPLTSLVATMGTVASGADHRLPPESGRDLSLVFSAFNRMADALATARSELVSQVDRKTVALAQALEAQRGLNGRLEATLAELGDAQRRLAEKEKMAALGTLAGGVAHEFNNVLGGIRGCAGELARELVDPDQKETLAVVLRAAERGRRIVDGLRRFSRGASSEQRDVDLGKVASDVLHLFRSESERARVTLVDDLGSRPCWVRGDPTELHQVLDNLVRNALDATPPGGRVTLEISMREVDVEVRVRDTGSGVPGELRGRIFEPFFTTKERMGGTGLGLSISHGIVAALGGDLILETSSGVGATFTMRLPRILDHDPAE